MVAIVLSIIIFIGMIKEGLTDYARHKQDARTNNTPVVKIGCKNQDDKNFKVDSTLKDVKVGDVLFLENG